MSTCKQYKPVPHCSTNKIYLYKTNQLLDSWLTDFEWTLLVDSISTNNVVQSNVKRMYDLIQFQTMYTYVLCLRRNPV